MWGRPPSWWRSIFYYGSSWLADTWEPHLLPWGTLALWRTQVRVVRAVGEGATNQPTRAPYFHWGRCMQGHGGAAPALHIMRACGPGRRAAHHPIMSSLLSLLQQSASNLPTRDCWEEKKRKRKRLHRHYAFPLPTSSLSSSLSLSPCEAEWRTDEQQQWQWRWPILLSIDNVLGNLSSLINFLIDFSW